jgi:hypothetical protein
MSCRTGDDGQAALKESVMERTGQVLGESVLAGAAATAAMSVVMEAEQRAGWLENPLGPERITAAALGALGWHDRPRRAQDLLAVAMHFGFGSTLGAAFGLLRRQVRAPLAPTWQGIVFASIVWLLSCRGWIPVLGLLPPVRTHPSRPPAMLAAHWVYGAVLGTLLGRRGARS